MAKRFPLVVPYMDLVKNLKSTTPKAAVASNFKLSFSIANLAHVHTQVADPLVGAANQGAEKAAEVVGSTVEEVAKESVDTAWDAGKKTAQLVTDTTTAEADMNVVDTAEYRCAEDLTGQLGDGCDKI